MYNYSLTILKLNIKVFKHFIKKRANAAPADPPFPSADTFVVEIDTMFARAAKLSEEAKCYFSHYCFVLYMNLVIFCILENIIILEIILS